MSIIILLKLVLVWIVCIEEGLTCRRVVVFFKRGERVDFFSSGKTFEKVRQELEGAVGKLILLVKPEVIGGYRGSDRVEDYTLRIESLGVLAGCPAEGYPSEGEFAQGIVLPTERYIHGFREIKEGPIEFNCMNPEDVAISDSDRLSTIIGIYVGTRAIENFVDERCIVDYFKSMNFLGCEVSGDFSSRHEDAMEAGRTEFKDGLKYSIGMDIMGEASMEKEDWETARTSALAWGVQDETLRLNDQLSVFIGRYIEGML